MDYMYATEVFRQSLTDALEREDRLKSALHAAATEMQSLQTRSLEHKTKYQQLDDLLEAEEAKTHAERLARQEAEETTRQHRAEVLKLKRMEATANQHCEAAESEIISLQRELSTERSATVTAGKISTGLREDLGRAEANGIAAYDMLNTAKERVFALEHDLRNATDRISMLEHQLRGLEERVEKEHQRASKAEKTLSATASEIKKDGLKLKDLWEKYHALEAEHTNDTQSPITIHPPNSPSKHFHSPIPSIARSQSKEETPPIINTTPRTAKDRILETPHHELPSLPKPAILRPRLASLTACEVKILKTTGGIVPAATGCGNTKNLRWKFLWRFPGKMLRILIRDAGWG